MMEFIHKMQLIRRNANAIDIPPFQRFTRDCFPSKAFSNLNNQTQSTSTSFDQRLQRQDNHQLKLLIHRYAKFPYAIELVGEWLLLAQNSIARCVALRRARTVTSYVKQKHLINHRYIANHDKIQFK